MSIKMYFSFVHFLLTIILSVGIMIKLFKVKEKQKELAENANGKPPGKKQSAGELRLHKGFHFFFFFLVIPSFSEIRAYAETYLGQFAM